MRVFIYLFLYFEIETLIKGREDITGTQGHNEMKLKFILFG